MTEKMSNVKFNPWSNEDPFTTSLRNVISLAERMGYTKHGEEADRIRSCVAELPSIKHIKLQREITKQKKELEKINLEIFKRMQDFETRDMTHLDIIEKRTEKLKELNDHLQSVITHRDFFLTKLQQPFTGDFIRLESAFHKHASELFVQLAPVLSSLSSHVDDLIWLRQHDFADGVVDNHLLELSSALASLQTRFQTAIQLSHHVSLLHSGDTSHVSSQNG
ncbi:uncharacterized protein LOC112574583 [Pomacea canaliculata]|uniref:uncharacterized protein LOC112574583 n=1 Tax=Pomacea canaliculata TaxID=400727 RepID=UPI000D72F32D|nr:uncharacterized protein LOC112574583 [Pomacea canaliculata]